MNVHSLCITMTESLPPVQANNKKQQILHAAVHLLAQYGFQGFSMQKLANDAGVAAGTIYRYFNDKEHLIEEVRVLVLKGRLLKLAAKHQDLVPTDGNHSN